MTQADDHGLSAWVGRSETTQDICSLTLVRRIAALLDKKPSDYNESDPLPAGWQMCLFNPLTQQSDLRDDGHAKQESLMPPAPLPRRMLGGRRTWFHTPLTIGANLTRRSEIVAITPKTGNSGKLVLVTVRHTISQAGSDKPAIIEEQDSIFRDDATRSTSKPVVNPKDEMPSAAFSVEMQPDTKMLFRYSAIGFNTHRIHYDYPYATQKEGYPGLVVNGGLAGLLLTDSFENQTGRQVQSFEARNKGAIICGQPIFLCGAQVDEKWRLWIQNDKSKVVLEAIVT